MPKKAHLTQSISTDNRLDEAKAESLQLVEKLAHEVDNRFGLDTQGTELSETPVVQVDSHIQTEEEGLPKKEAEPKMPESPQGERFQKEEKKSSEHLPTSFDDEWVKEKARREEEVALARQAYVETLKIQEKELGLYNKIKKTLAIKVELKEDEAIAGTKKAYQAKLKALQDAELARIQETGLQGDAMSLALEETLRVLQVDEKLRLYEAKIDADLAEREVTFPGRMISQVEKIIGWYEKQPMKTKILIAAGFMAGAGAASLAGAVFAGGSLVALRRSFSMVSTATAANALLEKRANTKRKEELEEVTRDNGKVIGTEKEMIQIFQEKCARFFESVDEDLEEWQRSDQKRRLIAAGIGIGGGLAASEAMQLGMEYGGNDFVREKLGQLGVHFTGDAATTSQSANETPAAAIEPNKVTASPALAPNPEITPSVASTQAVEAYLQARSIEKGDSLWKHSMELGQNIGLETNVDQMRFSKMLENAIREKLEAHPELISASGFKDGESLHLIAGKTLDIGSIMSAEEIQEIADEAQHELASAAESEAASTAAISSEAQHSSGMGDEVITGKSNGVVQAYAREEASMGIKPGTIAAASAVAGLVAAQELMGTSSAKKTASVKASLSERIEPTLMAKEESLAEDPQDAPYKAGMDITAYLTNLESEERRSDFRKEMRRLGDDIFLPQIYRGDAAKDYNLNRTIIHLSVQNILDLQQEGFVLVGEEAEQRAILGLDSEQGKRLHAFVEVCQASFGKIAQPGKKEDVKNYLARMTALSLEKKKSIKLPPFVMTPTVKEA